MERVVTPIREDRFDSRYWLRSESTNNDVALHLTIDGEGAPIGAGAWEEAFIPFDGYITGWALLSDTAASCTVDVHVSSVADYPPDDTGSITGGAVMSLLSAQSAESDDLALWTREVSDGDVLRFVVETATDLYSLTIVLRIARPGVLIQQIPGLEGKADLVHDHDDRYYTEAEIDALIGTLAGSHNHDDRYYTKTEIGDIILAHDHDGRYYTESEVNSLLAAKANLSHQHGAADITSGILNAARVPSLDASKIISGVLPLSTIPVIDAARVPNLDAAKITSGSFGTGQIPDLDAGKIATGVFAVNRIPQLTTSWIASGTFDAARLPAAEWPTVRHFENKNLTTINVPDNTETGFDGATLGGFNSNRWYLCDVEYSVSGYGDAGTNGAFQLYLKFYGADVSFSGLTSGAYYTSTVQLAQGVNATHTFRRQVWVLPSGGAMGFSVGHKCISGVYTFRYQQVNYLLRPATPY